MDPVLLPDIEIVHALLMAPFDSFSLEVQSVISGFGVGNLLLLELAQIMSNG